MNADTKTLSKRSRDLRHWSPPHSPPIHDEVDIRTRRVIDACGHRLNPDRKNLELLAARRNLRALTRPSTLWCPAFVSFRKTPSATTSPDSDVERSCLQVLKGNRAHGGHIRNSRALSCKFRSSQEVRLLSLRNLHLRTASAPDGELFAERASFHRTRRLKRAVLRSLPRLGGCACGGIARVAGGESIRDGKPGRQLQEDPAWA